MKASSKDQFKAQEQRSVDDPVGSPQSEPTPAPNAAVTGTAPAEAGEDATNTRPPSETTSAAPQQQISILDPEPREVDFLKFDLSAVEGKSELEKRRHADSMDLPALGTFIRQGLHGLKRLVEAYRPYIENFMERTAHQGEQKLLTNQKGEPASREEVVREQLGVGVRRVNQLLVATGPEQSRTTKTHLTELQKEVVEGLTEQGFAKKDAVVMTKAATGEDFDTLFRSALSREPGNPPPSNSSAPAPPDPVPAVVAEAPVRIDQNSEEQLDGEAESGGPPPPMVDAPVVEPSVVGGEESAPEADPQIAELEQLKQERAELQKQLELAKSENSSLLQRLEALYGVPENIKDDQITASLAAEPDRDVASKMLTENLRAHANQFANGRITIKEVTARIEFVGRDCRILPGDWLEKTQKNAAPTLCKCVGVAEFMKRRKVREWSDGQWQKEHVVFSADESDYRVISEAAARKMAPEAFEPPEKLPVGL